MSRALTRLYALLVVIRVLCAFLGTGYIHPDEYFQNGEVTAGDVLGLSTLRTWEWDSSSPARSAFPPFMTTGIGFAVAKILGLATRPRSLFLTQRLVFLILSFILDFSVTQLVPIPQSRISALLLIASSHVANAFQVRPFSNSLESVFLALSFVRLKRLLETKQRKTNPIRSNIHLHLLAAIFVLGAFTRITFLASSFPIVLQALLWSIRTASTFQRPFLSIWLKLILPPAGTAVLITGLILASDALYFHSNLSNLVLTPINFLAYNLSTKAAAEHGVHPRWLHVLVNLPMIAGPGVVLHAVRAAVKQRWLWVTSTLANDKVGDGDERDGEDVRQKVNVNLTMQQTMVYTIALTLLVLSVPRHQEPRFLVPLLVPFVVFIVNSGEHYRLGRIFWTTWILSNVILTLLFGFLHQGGVVPSLFYVHGRLSGELSLHASAHIDVIYWRTYMPPRHLLCIPKSYIDTGRIPVNDLAGASPSTVSEIIQQLILSIPSPSTCRKLYLVAPFWATHELDTQMMTLETRVYPHLDMDHLGESMGLGIRDGLALGVYALSRNCGRQGGEGSPSSQPEEWKTVWNGRGLFVWN